MIIAVRHGETQSNIDGQEKLRGWLNIPLTTEGMKNSHETAKLLAKTAKDAKDIHTSDMVRAVQSSHMIGHEMGKEIIPTTELRDWNTGDLAGSKITPELIEKLKGYIKDGKTLPGGESYDEFKDRILPILRHLIEDKDLHILVSHGRVMTLLKALSVAKGKEPDLNTLMDRPPVDPSGIMVMGRDYKIHYTTPKPEKGGRQS